MIEKRPTRKELLKTIDTLNNRISILEGQSMLQQLDMKAYASQARVGNEEIERLTKDNESLKKQVVELKSKPTVPDYSFSSEPEKLEELKQNLKYSDVGTLDMIKDYLRIDNYLLVKNLASTVANQHDADMMIAFRDGALSRNEALIRLFEAYKKNNTFVNRSTGEMQRIKKESK